MWAMVTAIAGAAIQMVETFLLWSVRLVTI